ncbi:M13 family metallopeptidase [Promicromonospora citrea]|uniref:Peptidase M13 n=1 Tax=Promicromonospora citrea TaxID=43677 RepID=A0A8H9GI83_9MICO|nr:M13-type metalloendopeptidase [Promicromonospora citrea]NNH51097.1 peptidase M13 [Promicromonospora citrea]GGM30359.1 peptidase M13 [Promicromonospora citrea]
MTTDATGLTSGIDLDALDPDTRPQDDLYRHVNGRWIDTYEIPADRAMDGAFRALYDQAEVHVREIIQDAPAGSLIGDLYASFMDTERIAALGTAPLDEDLALVRAATDVAALTRALGTLQRTGGAAAVRFWVDNDAADPEKYVVYLRQSGLGLPDEAYYREEQYEPIRAAYQPHVARMLRLGGAEETFGVTAEDAAARVVELETRLAGHHWDVVRDRDATLTYNPTTLADLTTSAPGFDWAAWAAALGVPAGAFDQLVVREPSFATGFAALWQDLPLQDWQLWTAYHVISARAPYLTDEIVEANFDFYGRTLTGAQEVRERWKRGVALVEGALGEAVGEQYVARHFPPSHKERMDRLVEALVAAYRESIENLDWMTDETKAKALTKLEKFTPKVGYPVKWRDYSGFEVDPADLVGNVRRSNAFDQDYELAKIGRPLDRDEWFMTPQTVNAYYNPGMNEIVFPAAILQPPFFDPEADDAVNFGGIGGVIGHEIGHGFDDQGSKYDGDGRLEDWWTDADRAEFETRTRALIAQYDAFVPAQLAGAGTGPGSGSDSGSGSDEAGAHVNGSLTIGENIGDLGGLSIAIKAYRIALGKPLEEAPVIDGLTALERIFLGWAQVWQSKGRDEEVLRRLATDPHSPNEFRCNGVVRNVDEFYTTYDVQPGDALYLAPEARVRIW